MTLPGAAGGPGCPAGRCHRQVHPGDLPFDASTAGRRSRNTRAFSSLGIAVMAFILHGRTTQFRAKVALVAATGVFAFGAAGGHIYQMFVNNDHAANNTGLLLVMDVAIALAGIAMVSWVAASRRHAAAGIDQVGSPVLAAAG